MKKFKVKGLTVSMNWYATLRQELKIALNIKDSSIATSKFETT